MRLAIFILLASIGIHAVGQAPADFSGQWSVNTTPPAAGAPGASAPATGDMGSGWGSTMTITQTATHLTIEPTVYSRYDLQPQPRYVYALDGSESRNTLMLGRGMLALSSRAFWQGASLRITTAHPYADPVSGEPLVLDISQTLSFDGVTLVVTTARSAALGGLPSLTKTIYTRR